MRRRGLLIVVAVLLILVALGAVFILPSLFGGGGGGQAAATPTAVEVTATPEQLVNIVAAAQNLPRGAVIPADAITLIPWPAARVPPSAITDTAQIVDKRARYTIAQGEVILKTMVVSSLLDLSPYGSDAAAQIPSGMVAITVPYDKRFGVAQAPQAGDHVNVVVSWALVDLDQDFQTVLPNLTANVVPPGPGDPTTGVPAGLVAVIGTGGGEVGRGSTDPTLNQDIYLVPSEAQRPRVVSQGIIQDAVILFMGDYTGNAPTVELPPPTPGAAPAAAEGTATPPPPPTPTPLPPDSITLVVSYQDALVLNYINQLAQRYPGSVQMTLVLRSAGDTTQAETESVTLQYMFERFNITLPAKLPYGVANPSGPAATATPAP